MVLINIFTSVSKLKNISIIFFAILIVLAPQQSIYNYLYKDNVKYSQIKMSPYIETSDRTKKYISKDNANIYIISQQDKGFDFLALRYNMRPNTCFMSGTPWSIGIPFYEGDIWTTEINGDEWKEILKSECDYVLLYRLNDYFINNYKSVFNEPEDIKEGELYKVNKSNGMLSLVKSTVN